MEIINLLLGFFQLLTILLICLFEYKNNFSSVFIWAMLLIVFGLPHFFTSLVGSDNYSNVVLSKASSFVILFNLIYLLVRYLLKLTIHKTYSYDYDSNFFRINNIINTNVCDKLTNSNKRYLNMCLLMLTGMFIVIFQMMGGFKGASWGKYFSFYSKGYGNIMLYFVYLFYAMSGVAINYLKYGLFLKSIIAVLVIIFTAIITNTKMMFIPIFLSFLAPIVFCDNNKFTIKKIVLAIIALISVLYIINFFYVLRSYGNLGNIFNNLTLYDLNTKIINMISNSEGELGTRNAFYLFIKENNNFKNFNKGHTYVRLLMMLIPSKFSLNLKPQDFAVSMGSAFIGNPYNTIYSMHPTLYGDSFANFEWYGIFLGIFWAIITHIIDKFIQSKSDIIRNMLMISVCTCYIMIGRGSIYNSCFTITSSIFIIMSLSFISRIRIYFPRVLKRRIP